MKGKTDQLFDVKGDYVRVAALNGHSSRVVGKYTRNPQLLCGCWARSEDQIACDGSARLERGRHAPPVMLRVTPHAFLLQLRVLYGPIKLSSKCIYRSQNSCFQTHQHRAIDGIHTNGHMGPTLRDCLCDCSAGELLYWSVGARGARHKRSAREPVSRTFTPLLVACMRVCLLFACALVVFCLCLLAFCLCLLVAACVLRVFCVCLLAFACMCGMLLRRSCVYRTARARAAWRCRRRRS